MSPRAESRLAALLVGLLMLVAVYRAAVGIADPDVWWHLRLGRELIDRGPWSTPPWSELGTHQWTLSEPLPEMLFAQIESWTGLSGVAWVYGVALLVLNAVVFVRLRSLAEPLPAAIATLVSMALASPSLTMRPQLISFFLIVVVLWAWWSTERDGRPRWWLVPLTLLWVWCHGFWIVGLGISGLCWLGLVIDGRLRGRSAAHGGGVILASALVPLLTSAGPRIYLAPIEVRATAGYITEWARPGLLEFRSWLIVAVVAVVMIAWRQREVRPSVMRVLLLLVALVLAWTSLRLIAVSAILIGPLLAEALQTLRGTAVEPDQASSARRRIAALGVATLSLAAVLAVLVPFTADRPGGVPTSLDPYLDDAEDGTVVLNYYDVGGWLSWRHPNLEQAIDGLIVPYPPGYVSEYVAALGGRPGWRSFVWKTGARVALLDARVALVPRLESVGWRVIAREDSYVLLLAPADGG